MRTELLCLENVVPGIDLSEFQNIGIQEMLLNKKMLLAFDTGTGKTFTYATFVRALLNRNPEKKHIFVIIHDSLEQAVKDIRSLAAAPVRAFSNVQGEYGRLRRMWGQLSVIVLTYECFSNLDTLLFLYEHLTEIESFVIDEAHHASNWDVSDTAFLIRAMCKYIPFVSELSATPATSKSVQYFQALNVIDRSLSPRRDETPLGKYNDRYFPVNRSDYGIKGRYKTTLEVVTPMKHQVGPIKGIVSRVMKGSGAVNQVATLVSVVKSRLEQGKSIIIYVNYHDSREWIEKHLEESGISFVSLHGKITDRSQREAILKTFSSRQADVLITSVAESLNIDSDVVVFYEFTTKLKQVMGRAHRGLEGKELELVFIVTRDSAETEFFYTYIYQRSLTLQRLLRKDYSEFIEIGRKLEEMRICNDS